MESLQNVFTNSPLDAVQRLPKGQGVGHISIGKVAPGKVSNVIRDSAWYTARAFANGYRPFQTTKERGSGIGSCHTRPVVDVYGSHIRIASQLNRGSTEESEFPRI